MELKQELEELKIAQAGLTATQAGGMATMAASQAGVVGIVTAGAVGLIIGIFLGISLAPRR
jgi:hypothetical protein